MRAGKEVAAQHRIGLAAPSYSTVRQESAQTVAVAAARAAREAQCLEAEARVRLASAEEASVRAQAVLQARRQDFAAVWDAQGTEGAFV